MCLPSMSRVLTMSSGVVRAPATMPARLPHIAISSGETKSVMERCEESERGGVTLLLVVAGAGFDDSEMGDDTDDDEATEGNVDFAPAAASARRSRRNSFNCS